MRAWATLSGSGRARVGYEDLVETRPAMVGDGCVNVGNGSLGLLGGAFEDDGPLFAVALGGNRTWDSGCDGTGLWEKYRELEMALFEVVEGLTEGDFAVFDHRDFVGDAVNFAK